MKAALIGYGYWGKIIEKYICDPDVNINYLKILLKNYLY